MKVKMSNSINHIGLQVIDVDVHNFYVDVLNFNHLRSFQLSRKEAKNIFGIEKDINILFGECAEIDLELFIVDTVQKPSFGHVCFHSRRIAEMAEIANRNGYKIFYRGNKENETLFISDSNYNVFEIKHFL